MTDSSDLLNGLLPFPVSFTMLAVGLLVAIAIIASIRGVLRLFFASVALAVGAVAAYFTYQNAPLFLTAPRTILFVSLVAGLITFLGARVLILGILLRPFLGSHRGAAGGVGALLSILPAALLIWILASGFRLTGTIVEMEDVGENVTAEDGAPVSNSWIAHWREAMDNDSLARLLAKIDPFLARGKATLVNLLISSRDSFAPDDLAAANPDAAAIINSSEMRQLQADPEIRKLIKGGEYVHLLQHPKVRQASRDPGFADRLNSVDIPGSMEKALYYSDGSGQQPKVRRRIPRRLWRHKEE